MLYHHAGREGEKFTERERERERDRERQRQTERMCHTMFDALK